MYEEVVEYFRGAASAEALNAPWAYRQAIPWLAAQLPLSPWAGLAFVNLVGSLVGFVVLAVVYARILARPSQVYVALLLLIVSFPTVNFGSAALTEGGAYAFYALAFLSLVQRWWAAFIATVVLGVAFRETVLIAPFAAFLAGIQLRSLKMVGVALASCAASLPLLWWLRQLPADAPAYVWKPAIDGLLQNLSQPVSLLSMALTCVPLAVLYLYGQHAAQPTRGSDGRGALQRGMQPEHRVCCWAWILSTSVLVSYSMLAAFMSGRFAWPAYVAACPLVAVALHDTPLSRRLLAPLAYLLFLAPCRQSGA